MLCLLLLLIVAVQLIQQSSALLFLARQERKCFTFEQPRDTPMIFAYDIIDEGHEIGFDLYYGTLAQLDLQIMHKVLTGHSGHVDFTADNDGVYSYCIQQPPSSSAVSSHEEEEGVAAKGTHKVKPTRMKMALHYGFDSEHYQHLVEKYNYDSVNLQVHKLNDMLTLALNEADYQKHKEVEYHEQTEKMNNAALWWPVVQIGILILTGIYQVQHLKSFFKSNKLI